MTSHSSLPSSDMKFGSILSPRLTAVASSSPIQQAPADLWSTGKVRQPTQQADDNVLRRGGQASNVVAFPRPLRGARTKFAPIVRAAVVRSRSIAELHDDWDGEGSRGCDLETSERAVEVLMGIARGVLENREKRLSVAELTPGPDGSIEFEVVVGQKRLLINAARDADSPILYYGHATNRSFPIEGELKPTSSLRCLSEWLVA